jgi:hypothetical protein
MNILLSSQGLNKNNGNYIGGFNEGGIRNEYDKDEIKDFGESLNFLNEEEDEVCSERTRGIFGERI